jgi:hypothetical protein
MSDHTAIWRNKNKKHERLGRGNEAREQTIDLAAAIQKLADRTNERRARRKARSFSGLVAALNAKQ